MSEKKQKRIFDKSSLKHLVRVGGVSVGVVALSFVLVAQEAFAYYNDSEASRGNLFTATSLDFSLHEEGEEPFTTYTQGGWGSEAHGDNPGTYRDANFDGAFPDGAVIGDPDDGLSVVFTSSAAVENFLPAGGTPGALSSDDTDPTATDAGVFAGQVLALTLNLGLDAYDVDFGPSSEPFSGWEMDDAGNPCFGIAAGAILDEANIVLGGGTAAHSASQLNDCATGVNERFEPAEDEAPSPYLMPGDSREFSVILQKDAALDFNYQLAFSQTDGNAQFCSRLNLRAALNGSDKYDASLADLDAGPFDELGTWTFEITYPSALPAIAEGALCAGDILFEGWQYNLPVYPNGYSDEESVSISLVNRSIVLNEFLPNPTGPDDGGMPDGEWVELYNLSGFDTDVVGWYLYDKGNAPLVVSASNSDNNADFGDSGETIVPGGGYLVVYLDGLHSPGWLNNTGGDEVRLYSGDKDAGGLLIDEHQYHGSAAEDKSYARIPDGTGNWVDPIPTPLKPNVLEGEGAVVNVASLPVVEITPAAPEEEAIAQAPEEQTDYIAPPQDEVIEAPVDEQEPADTEIKLEDPVVDLPQPTALDEEPADGSQPADGGDGGTVTDNSADDEAVAIVSVDNTAGGTVVAEDVPPTPSDDEVVVVQDIVSPQDNGETIAVPTGDEPVKQEDSPAALELTKETPTE